MNAYHISSIKGNLPPVISLGRSTQHQPQAALIQSTPYQRISIASTSLQAEEEQTPLEEMGASVVGVVAVVTQTLDVPVVEVPEPK